MRRSLIAISTIAIAIFGLSFTAAAEPADAYSISVPVSDADLENVASVQALYTRVQQAANAVCAETLRDTSARMSTDTCRREVFARAIARADLPALTQYHAAIQSGRTPELTTEIAAR